MNVMKREMGTYLTSVLLLVFLVVFVLAAAPNTPTINAPDNNTYTSSNYNLLNFSVTDPDGDNMRSEEHTSELQSH